MLLCNTIYFYSAWIRVNPIENLIKRYTLTSYWNQYSTFWKGLWMHLYLLKRYRHYLSTFQKGTYFAYVLMMESERYTFYSTYFKGTVLVASLFTKVLCCQCTFLKGAKFHWYLFKRCRLLWYLFKRYNIVKVPFWKVRKLQKWARTQMVGYGECVPFWAHFTFYVPLNSPKRYIISAKRYQKKVPILLQIFCTFCIPFQYL